MSTEQIASLAAIVLSLLFSYVPGLSDWFTTLTGIHKRLVMAGLLVIVALGSVAYTCQADAACYTANWQAYLNALVAALIANQSAYLITPK